MALVRLLRGMAPAALLAVFSFGCAEQSETVTTTLPATVAAPAIAANDAVTPMAGKAAAPVLPVSLPEPSEKPASALTPPTPTDEAATEPNAASYTPPFPDRVDLFVPPKRQGGVVLKEGGTEDAVELLGFIRLDKQQVVLSVNGQLTRIAEGDSQYGIEVISIQPPEVVLQRGRQRWQASLEK